jgi:hypothetical protein
MAGCLDLCAMASSSADGCYTTTAKAHLCSLVQWARPPAPTRIAPFLSGGAAEQDGIALPVDEVLADELDALARALRAASSEQLIGKRWRWACSSTELMADVFTLPTLYECCPNWLYLYQHCALKGVPEAIVEGMGGVWDRCAMLERHISFEAGVQEAVICWNAPSHSYHADSTISWSAHSPSTSRVPPGISRTRRQPRHGAPSRAKSYRGSQSMGPSCPVVWKTLREPLRPAGRAAPACPTLSADDHGIPPRVCPSSRPRV